MGNTTPEAYGPPPDGEGENEPVIRPYDTLLHEYTAFIRSHIAEIAAALQTMPPQYVLENTPVSQSVKANDEISAVLQREIVLRLAAGLSDEQWSRDDFVQNLQEALSPRGCIAALGRHIQEEFGSVFSDISDDSMDVAGDDWSMLRSYLPEASDLKDIIAYHLQSFVGEAVPRDIQILQQHETLVVNVTFWNTLGIWSRLDDSEADGFEAFLFENDYDVYDLRLRTIEKRGELKCCVIGVDGAAGFIFSREATLQILRTMASHRELQQALRAILARMFSLWTRYRLQETLKCMDASVRRELLQLYDVYRAAGMQSEESYLFSLLERYTDERGSQDPLTLQCTVHTGESEFAARTDSNSDRQLQQLLLQNIEVEGDTFRAQLVHEETVVPVIYRAIQRDIKEYGERDWLYNKISVPQNLERRGISVCKRRVNQIGVLLQPSRHPFRNIQGISGEIIKDHRRYLQQLYLQQTGEASVNDGCSAGVEDNAPIISERINDFLALLSARNSMLEFKVKILMVAEGSTVLAPHAYLSNSGGQQFLQN